MQSSALLSCYLLRNDSCFIDYARKEKVPHAMARFKKCSRRVSFSCHVALRSVFFLLFYILFHSKVLFSARVMQDQDLAF